MESNNRAVVKNNKMDDIDQKIDRLQRKNEAEWIALKKILEGLEKIEKSKPKSIESKMNKNDELKNNTKMKSSKEINRKSKA